jgi:hypothetical protein
MKMDNNNIAYQITVLILGLQIDNSLYGDMLHLRKIRVVLEKTNERGRTPAG